jgi:hypothetical protein
MLRLKSRIGAVNLERIMDCIASIISSLLLVYNIEESITLFIRCILCADLIEHVINGTRGGITLLVEYPYYLRLQYRLRV